MGSTHQLCLAGQISCLTFFSNLAFVYAGDSADFRFSGDRKSASDCNDFCRTSFCGDFDLTLCLIDADDPPIALPSAASIVRSVVSSLSSGIWIIPLFLPAIPPA